MRQSGTIRVAAGLVLLLVLFGATLSQARAGGSADLVIHSRLCPDGYSGNNLFADCHDTPLPGRFFAIVFGGLDSGAAYSDSAGNVTFADLIPGSYSVSIGLEPYHVNQIVYCSLDGAEGTLMAPPRTDQVTYQIDIPADFSGSVICDWYLIQSCVEWKADCWTPTPDVGDTPALTPVAGDSGGGGAVTDLPNTGAGDASDSATNIVLYAIGVLALGMTTIAVRWRATR